jgi:uncharacterized Zn finger protein
MLFNVLFCLFSFGIISFFIIKIYKVRQCEDCSISMKRELSEEYETIYKCLKCGKIKHTGIYFGADDS